MLTIYPFASMDDIAKGHRLDPLFCEMGKNTWTKVEFLVEIRLCETIVAKIKLGGTVGTKVRVEDTERVKISDMVSTNLVRPNEQLDLESIRQLLSALYVQGGCSTGGTWDVKESRGWLKSLAAGKALVETRKVSVP
jgi:hypothetical protein